MKSFEGQSSHEDMSNPPGILNPGGTVRPSIFMGPNGIRAGWRLLIFAAIFAPLFYAADRIVDSLAHGFNVDPYSPLVTTIEIGVFAVAVFLASCVMAKIEGGSIAD